MEKWLDIATALFAFSAAVFWFWSALRKLPPMVAHWDATPESDPFRVAITFAAKLNQWAAGLTGLSALCMAMKIVVQKSG
jgi:hypothetical protein